MTVEVGEVENRISFDRATNIMLGCEYGVIKGIIGPIRFPHNDKLLRALQPIET